VKITRTLKYKNSENPELVQRVCRRLYLSVINDYQFFEQLKLNLYLR